MLFTILVSTLAVAMFGIGIFGVVASPEQPRTYRATFFFLSVCYILAGLSVAYLARTL